MLMNNTGSRKRRHLNLTPNTIPTLMARPSSSQLAMFKRQTKTKVWDFPLKTQPRQVQEPEIGVGLGSAQLT